MAWLSSYTEVDLTGVEVASDTRHPIYSDAALVPDLGAAAFSHPATQLQGGQETRHFTKAQGARLCFKLPRN